jgi:RNA polymerase-interacting CarD/CdnL/TRCF family regulator
MSDGNQDYDIGHWVVHSRYGVGQIKKIEKIPLHADPTKKEQCFQVQTGGGVFWFPIEQHDNPRIRPVITQNKLNSALRLFEEAPADTNLHRNELRIRITETQMDVSINTAVRLIRDLLARNVTRKLNIYEDRALRTHMERFIREWALCKEIDEKEARTEFDLLLRKRNLLPA